MRVVFRPLAEQDLDEIDDWIAAHDPARAEAFVQNVRRRCAILSQFPLIGRPRDDLAPGIRTLNFDRRVLVAYRIVDERVEIGRILYRGRDVRRLTREPW